MDTEHPDMLRLEVPTPVPPSGAEHTSRLRPKVLTFGAAAAVVLVLVVIAMTDWSACDVGTSLLACR